MLIGKFSEVSGVTIRTLHHYEAIGLMPKAKRKGSYRVYEKTDLERMEFIQLAKELGFNLKEISEFAHMYSQPKDQLCQNSLRYIQNKTGYIQKELDILTKKLTQLQSIEKIILEKIKEKER